MEGGRKEQEHRERGDIPRLKGAVKGMELWCVFQHLNTWNINKDFLFCCGTECAVWPLFKWTGKIQMITPQFSQHLRRLVSFPTSQAFINHTVNVSIMDERVMLSSLIPYNQHGEQVAWNPSVWMLGHYI
jgi:hypothetical protein